MYPCVGVGVAAWLAIDRDLGGKIGQGEAAISFSRKLGFGSERKSRKALAPFKSLPPNSSSPSDRGVRHT